MGKVNWTREAELWLRDIHEYIALDNPRAAAETIQSIYSRAEILETFPEAGFIYRQKSSRNIRILLYGHYRIAYWLKTDGAIDILGVFHGALDIDRYLM